MEIKTTYNDIYYIKNKDDVIASFEWKYDTETEEY